MDSISMIVPPRLSCGRDRVLLASRCQSRFLQNENESSGIARLVSYKDRLILAYSHRHFHPLCGFTVLLLKTNQYSVNFRFLGRLVVNVFFVRFNRSLDTSYLLFRHVLKDDGGCHCDSYHSTSGGQDVCNLRILNQGTKAEGKSEQLLAQRTEQQIDKKANFLMNTAK